MAAACGDPEVEDKVLLVARAMMVPEVEVLPELVPEAALVEVNATGLGVGLTGPVRVRPAGKGGFGEKRIEERAN